jgi:ActR/RegA family two-component response regulator
VPGRTASGKSILFVDDEPSICATLPAILEQNGFKVRAVGTVADALKAIHSEHFDVLIADLNIGEPGDGFTVVSAMRRTQPICCNFILTGYPAFQSALEAIGQQVDDYFVKPSDVGTLVQTILDTLKSPRRIRKFQNQPLAVLLREHIADIVSRAILAMKVHSRLSALPLSDKDREDHLTKVVGQLAEFLESEPTEHTSKRLKAAAKHGKTRQRQGYSPILLVDDIRVLGTAIYSVVQENLLNLNMSNLILDLCRINDSLEAQLQEALQALLSTDAA